MVQTVQVAFLYVTDRTIILQLIKLSDLVQGHLPSDLLPAGWPTGHARATGRPTGGPWAMPMRPCGPRTRVRHSGTDAFIVLLHRVVLRWNRAKVIAYIDDLATSIWALKVIDGVSQIDDI